ncbi:hypothetical protein IMZ48_07255 [Candidatus Bathyarchaeota archaeon]|nr:hypothetical protein [Candidatus Bathyarchaeota archaeon]
MRSSIESSATVAGVGCCCCWGCCLAEVEGCSAVGLAGGSVRRAFLWSESLSGGEPLMNQRRLGRKIQIRMAHMEHEGSSQAAAYQLKGKQELTRRRFNWILSASGGAMVAGVRCRREVCGGNVYDGRRADGRCWRGGGGVSQAVVWCGRGSRAVS